MHIVLSLVILALASPSFGDDRDIRLVAAGGLTDAFNAMIVD
jgi:hypothetical protein